MPSKTFVPAFEAKVGNWTYYSCLMSYAQVAREINFAHELGGNRDLGTMIQRGVGARTQEITEYLLTNENRFLGALIIAVWGGDPNYLSVTMDAENQAVLQGLDRNFGVLTFDGTQQFFALDGQHRLKAIKDAIKQNPELGNEDINVIVVPHFDTDEGRRRTRRLFTNINRNAKSTNLQENIALDEDDSFAILTRRLLDEDEFLKRDKVVLVFSKVGQDGEMVLAQRSVNASSPAWSTIAVVYDIIKEIGYDLPCTSGEQRNQRATDELLDRSFELITIRFRELLDACGNLRQRYLASPSPKELRAPKGRDGAGHPFMRPAVQNQVAKVVRNILEQGSMEWSEIMKRLSALDWKMTAAPFSSMWIETPENTNAKGKMASGNSQLLYDLLQVHLAPRSKAQINRALRAYTDVMKTKYPVPVEELFALLPVDAD